MTIQVAFQNLVDSLTTYYGEREAANISRIVFEDALGIRATHQATPLPPSQLERLRSIQTRLSKHEPIQYILEAADFYGLKFKVSPAVLIPRQETEELVYWILQEHPKAAPLRVLDIGTGSGCIPLTLKKHRPSWQISALDVSPAALAIAQENAHRLNLEVTFLHQDILQPHSWPTLGPWDIIISNPPYIPHQEAHLLAPHVKSQEPHLALFVSDDDPLLFYRTISAFAKRQLAPSGCLYFEVNSFNGTEVVALLQDDGFSEVELQQDMQGNDRMVRGEGGDSRQ